MVVSEITGCRYEIEKRLSGRYRVIVERASDASIK